jgi:hypothetical protein
MVCFDGPTICDSDYDKEEQMSDHATELLQTEETFSSTAGPHQENRVHGCIDIGDGYPCFGNKREDLYDHNLDLRYAILWSFPGIKREDNQTFK